MKNKSFLIITLITSISLVSCVKSALQTPPPLETKPKNSTSNIAVPKGFTWENSRTINFTVNVTDTRFNGIAQIIAIYDGDPKTGGKIIARGAATPAKAFISKLYISNQVQEVYIKKTAADKSEVIQKVLLTSTKVSTSIGV